MYDLAKLLYVPLRKSNTPKAGFNKLVGMRARFAPQSLVYESSLCPYPSDLRCVTVLKDYHMTGII